MDKDKLKAIIAIRNYLNKDFSDDIILNNFSLAVDQLIENSLKIEDAKPIAGVSQITQGSQSMSFKSGTEAWTITDDIKLLLPTPYVRMW
ncbi:MAG: hypothetical protein ACRC7N_00565 [Clostridium sp.]